VLTITNERLELS